MPFNSYSAVRASLANWLSRDDLSTSLDDFIALAEERLARELRIRATEVTMNVTLSGGVAAIPSDYAQLKHVYIAGNPVQPLDPKESTWLYKQFPVRSSDSKPRFVAEDGPNFVFGPHPDSNYVLKGVYWKKPAALSSSNTTNEWTSDAPDALFFAALCESAPFLVNDERILVWEGKYAEAKDRINRAEKKRTRKGSRTAER